MLATQEKAGSPEGHSFFFWLMTSDAQATVTAAMAKAARAADYTDANGRMGRLVGRR